MKSSWDEREIKASHKETQQFYSYFLANISVDIKEKMPLPVRRSAGIGDNFYFNNCPKSMNSCVKKEIDHQKKAASPGKSSKCLYSEFTDIAKKLCWQIPAKFSQSSCWRLSLHPGTIIPASGGL